MTKQLKRKSDDKKKATTNNVKRIKQNYTTDVELPF